MYMQYSYRDLGSNLRPTIINSLFPVLVREKYHVGGWLLFIIQLKTIFISRINATYTLGIYMYKTYIHQCFLLVFFTLSTFYNYTFITD